MYTTLKYGIGNNGMIFFTYYIKAVIYPSIFVVFFCIVYSFMDNYKSDPLPIQSVIRMSIIPAAAFILLICLLGLSIFFNKIKKLNKNLIWNSLAWFLLPVAYIVLIFIHDLENRIKLELGFGNDFLYLVIMTIPYVIGLSWTFIQFRKEISTAHMKY